MLLSVILFLHTEPLESCDVNRIQTSLLSPFLSAAYRGRCWRASSCCRTAQTSITETLEDRGRCTLPPLLVTPGNHTNTDMHTHTHTQHELESTLLVLIDRCRQVCLLLKRGANQYAVDERGHDPLAIAVETANADIVTL